MSYINGGGGESPIRIVVQGLTGHRDQIARLFCGPFRRNITFDSPLSGGSFPCASLPCRQSLVSTKFSAILASPSGALGQKLGLSTCRHLGLVSQCLWLYAHDQKPQHKRNLSNLGWQGECAVKDHILILR